jgi:hypothetical protein
VDLSQVKSAIVAAVPPESRDTAVAYVVESPFLPGEEIPIDRRSERTSKPVYLGFIDLQPGQNWTHLCRYVLGGVDDNSVEIRNASFPPSMSGSQRRFTPVWVGRDVPRWAVTDQP